MKIAIEMLEKWWSDEGLPEEYWWVREECWTGRQCSIRTIERREGCRSIGMLSCFT